MAEQTHQVLSAQPSHRVAFQEIPWEQIKEPGAYVEKGTGDLYRLPQEAIGPASPIITKQSLGASRLVKISNNPFVTTLEARMLCAEANLQVNF